MRPTYLIATLVFLLLGCIPSSAQPVVQPPLLDIPSDALRRIDRKIVKEPSYKKSPKYGLVVLGAEAKFRGWLVIDGDTLYVDLNGNGALTYKGEKFKLEMTKSPHNGFRPPCKIGDISDPNTKLTHKECYTPCSQKNLKSSAQWE